MQMQEAQQAAAARKKKKMHDQAQRAASFATEKHVADTGEGGVVVVEAEAPPGWTPEFKDPFVSGGSEVQGDGDVNGRQGSAGDWNVPIKLDISQDSRVLKDTLTWSCRPSASGAQLTVEAFAKQVVDDSDLPESFISAIISQMNTQINEAIAYVDCEKDMGKVFSDAEYGSSGERLHKIKIEARVNDVVVEDTIVWDLKNSTNDVDAYSRQFCTDMQLPSDLVPVISQSIRDQIKNVRKSLTTGFGEACVVKPVKTLRGDKEADRWTPSAKWLAGNEKEVGALG
jgi:hypothetical protein